MKFINKLLEKDIKNRFNIYDALNDPWIKGAELLFKEKEKIDDTEIFLINIITDNLNLVHHVINKYYKCNKSDYDDYYQVGVIGLINASKNYKPGLDVSFGTYAYTCIKNEILNLKSEFAQTANSQ